MKKDNLFFIILIIAAIVCILGVIISINTFAHAKMDLAVLVGAGNCIKTNYTASCIGFVIEVAQDINFDKRNPETYDWFLELEVEG